MRRTSRRSSRASPRGLRLRLRYAFRPAVFGLEDRTLLSTVTWINDSAAPASNTGADRMMPLADAIAAHDAALTGWSSLSSQSPKRVTVRPNDANVRTDGARVGLVTGPPRTAVPQGALVDSALEGLGALPSLLSGDTPGSSSPSSRTRRPLA